MNTAAVVPEAADDASPNGRVVEAITNGDVDSVASVSNWFGTTTPFCRWDRFGTG